MFRNFVLFACCIVDLLPVEEVNAIKELVTRMDNKERVIRVGTFRERPLRYEEYAELGRHLLVEQKKLTQNKELIAVIDRIVKRRWANWHIRAAVDPRLQGRYMSPEAGV